MPLSRFPSPTATMAYMCVGKREMPKEDDGYMAFFSSSKIALLAWQTNAGRRTIDGLRQVGPNLSVD
jgi:hypothetical protein